MKRFACASLLAVAFAAVASAPANAQGFSAGGGGGFSVGFSFNFSAYANCGYGCGYGHYPMAYNPWANCETPPATYFPGYGWNPQMAPAYGYYSPGNGVAPYGMEMPYHQEVEKKSAPKKNGKKETAAEEESNAYTGQGVPGVYYYGNNGYGN